MKQYTFQYKKIFDAPFELPNSMEHSTRPNTDTAVEKTYFGEIV